MLRNLVALTSGNDAPEGAAALQFCYGRRLIALGREYPPEFYADLGGALLTAGDLTGAERAFAVIPVDDGLVDLDQIKGEAYARQGYRAQALANYGRALLRNQSSLDLALKTSILFEQNGDIASAADWYARARCVRCCCASRSLRARATAPSTCASTAPGSSKACC